VSAIVWLQQSHSRADQFGRFFITLAVESSALLQTEDEPEKHVSNEQDGKNCPHKFPRELWDVVFGTGDLKDDRRGGNRYPIPNGPCSHVEDLTLFYIVQLA
jgi:hypothetical protein